MSAPEIGALLQSLTPEQREKLAKGLNEASYQDLAGLKGIGPSALGNLLGVSNWRLGAQILTHARVLQYWGELGDAWPTFSVREEGVYFERFSKVRYRDRSGYISEIFHRRKMMLAILAHFNICVTDINEHLTEFRDIRARLAIFKTMDDPVIRDCLQRLAQDLAEK